MKKAFFYTILILFIFSSCSKDNSAFTPNVVSDNSNDPCASTLPFLKTGKKLVYELKFGSILLGSMNLDFGQCSLKGFEVERKTYMPNGTLNSSAIEYMKEEAGFLQSSTNGTEFYNVYKKNSVLGDTWQYTKGSAIITYEVIDMNMTITVPAGTFNCKVLKYKNSETINESIIHWNDEVGFVKEDNQISIMSLKSVN